MIDQTHFNSKIKQKEVTYLLQNKLPLFNMNFLAPFFSVSFFLFIHSKVKENIDIQ